MPPKSKTKAKEGIVIVVDVGPNVRASTSDATFYQQAKQCLTNILQRKIFAEKCKDMVSIVLFGTDDTSNNLASGDQYKHISVFQDVKFVDWELMKRVEQLPRGSSSGDWLDALIVAMDLLQDPQSLFYLQKKIVLLTDFNTDFTDDQAETIIKGLKNMEIDLTVIGPSIDDENEDVDMTDASTSNGPKKSSNPGLNWNGKVKTNQQLAAEFLIQRIITEVDGIICDFDEAIPELIFFEKHSQGSANWNAMMDIGPNLQIPVTGRIKIKRATPPGWKRCFAQNENEPITTEDSYHKKDVELTEVDKEETIAGYSYGTTLVPYGDEYKEENYVCEAPGAVMSVLGFTRAVNVPFELRAGDQVMVITAKEGDQDGSIVLSSLIQALKEMDMVAITRKVYRKKLNPVMGALFPDITPDYECLVWVGLPFQEDVRRLVLPPLKKVIDSLTDEQKSLMDQLITGMDLTQNDDEDEILAPSFVVNPQLQFRMNCLTQRAIAEHDPLPAPPQHILDILSPPALQRQARDLLAEKLSQHFPTQKFETKKKPDALASANGDQNLKANSTTGAATSSDLTSAVVTCVSTVSPAQDFRSLLKGDQPNYASICRQMEQVILQLSENLTGDNGADNILITKIITSLKCFREEALMIDCSPYNILLPELKKLVLARSFNHLWFIIKTENLGLITTSETLKSPVTTEEAEQFLAIIQSAEESPVVPVDQDNNYDDMLDDL